MVKCVHLTFIFSSLSPLRPLWPPTVLQQDPSNCSQGQSELDYTERVGSDAFPSSHFSLQIKPQWPLTHVRQTNIDV